MAYEFKPWEKPTRAKPTPESVTVELPPAQLLKAKIDGIRAYESPWAAAANLDDPARQWYLCKRELDGGRVLYLEPMTTGSLSLCIATDKWSISDRYCYHDHDAAWRAILGWNGKGDPEGWYRHQPSGRRRPDYTIESEYISP